MLDVCFGKNGEFIERVSKQGEELSLLAKGDGIEIMTQRFQENIVFWIDPGEDGNMMEFFYILKGNIQCEDTNKSVILKEGDYFYTQNLKESVHFKALTEISMLYVASQPVFHFLSNEIISLSEMRKKVEEKDRYTHDHGKRLRDYSIRIGERLGLSKKQLDILYYSAFFHDIGKINVPDNILKKPEKLTDEEFEYIKKHPKDGEKIIINTFLRESAQAIVQHHERLDGSGYPNNLKGKDICIEAKILAVVDTYDAMTSDRPYRKGIEPNIVTKEIKSLIGKHYDESIVLTLEEILKEDKIIA